MRDISTQTGQIRAQIRGSGLLLSGAFLSSLINFVAQALVARYLSTTAYGAWGYALSVVAFLQIVARFGLPDAVARFVPIYHENRDYRRMFGTMLLSFGTVIAAGAILAILAHSAPNLLATKMNIGESSMDVLLILIFVVPIDAADALLMSVFASFASPRAIFVRRHVLAPGLKLAVVVLLITVHSSVQFLAYGYLLASGTGVLLYCALLLRLLHQDGALSHVHHQRVLLPAKQLFSFAIPGVTSDLLSGLGPVVAVATLGYFFEMNEVAVYRVVLPAAAMNTVVMLAFTTLYTPTAARMFAKHDLAGINTLYWRTAIWVSVLTFPIFCATFCMSRTFTTLVYGAKYSQSSNCLAILALGYYFNAALGMNGLTLKVLGKIRYLMTCNVLVMLTGTALCLILIPRYGPLGAAIATSSAMIFHNCLKQAGLKITAGISIFDRQYLSFYSVIIGIAGTLYLLEAVAGAHLLTITLSAVGSLAIIGVVRSHLNIPETFPEILKIPLLRTVLAGSTPQPSTFGN